VDQQRLVKQYYRGYIPHVVVLDDSGRAVYNEAGEVSESKISGVLDRLLMQPSR
jgi:predicted transcriptional regulator